MLWQKKLYLHEELPPPEVWDEIKKTLEEEPYQVRQSLFTLSETPPAEVWEKVAAAIKTPEAEQPKRIIHNIRRTALSYAAAITGIGFFISLLVFLLNNKADQVGVKDLAAGLNFQDSPLIDDNKSDTADNFASILPEKSATADQVTQTPQNKPAAENITPRISPNLAVVQNEELMTIPQKVKTKPAKSTDRTINTVSYSDGNYILVYGSDGAYKRVSYKLADMVHSLHETNPSAKKQTAETQRWNKVLSEWKEKVGQSTFIPSGTNFFDIAEMAEMLNAEN